MIREGLPATVVYQGMGTNPPGTGDIGEVNLTGVSANIATTVIVNTRPRGLYWFEGVAECTSTSAGTISVTATWTDDAGGSTAVIATLPMSATGRASLSNSLSIYLASGNLSYSTSGWTSGRYALRFRCFYGGA